MAELEVHVIAPERRLWRGAASFVSAPAANGDIGILPQHEPILALLRAGTVRVHPTGGQTLEFHVQSGVLSVDSDVVTVLAETAHTRQFIG
jgi:F-type H+-transporting ATPase subunit epsilon